jgi:uncharacterized protein (DUF58 family)
MAKRAAKPDNAPSETSAVATAPAAAARKRPRRAGGPKRTGRVAKALLLVAALLLCGIPPIFLAHPISYVPLIMVVISLLISFIYLRILKRTFSFSEDGMLGSCERGEGVGLAVTLRNGSILPHARIDVSFYITDLFGEYDALRTMVVPLGPRETATFDFAAAFTHLGTYSAGVDSIVLTDLFGLFSCTIQNTKRRQVAVRPRLFDFNDVEISEAEEESASMLKPITDDGTDYSSVREYHYGDPLKTVHWNLSARSATGTMYTRLFETYVTPSMAAVIDPFAEGGDRETLMSLFDGMVEGAASLSRFARSQGVECAVRYLDRNFEPASICLAGEGDADELVLNAHRIVSLSSGADGEEAADALRASTIPVDLLLQEGLSSQGASNIAFITSRLSEDILSALSDVAARRRQAMLVLVVPATLIGRERAEFLAPTAQLGAAGIPYFILESTELETRRVLS